VTSAEAARRNLAEKGMVAEDKEIVQGRTGPRYFFISDPDGIQVEISEDNRDFWNESA
jgi:glyoxylase I family protein